MKILDFLTQIGTKHVTSQSERRNIVLSNYTSVVVGLAIYVLIGALIAYYGFDRDMVLRLALASLFFFAPLVLNSLGAINLSRVILCWLVPLVVFTVTVLDLKSGEQMSSSSFVGLRLFLVAGACFPFLFFNLRDRISLIFAFSVPVLSIFFFDTVIAFFDVAFLRNPDNDQYYEFNNVRAIISFLAIGFSLLFLRRIVEQNELTNEQLLTELGEKNKLLKETAEAEVNKLNIRLKQQLADLQISESKFRGAFEFSAMGMALVSLDGAFLKVNRQMCQMVGCDEEELIGLNVKTISIESESTFGETLQKELLKGNAEYVKQVRTYRHKNGSDVFVNLTVSLIRDSALTPMYFVAQLEDVTKQLDDSKKIKLYEANIRATINNTDIFIWSVDLNYNLLMFNEAFASYMRKNYNVELELGKRIFGQSDSEHPNLLIEKWSRLYEQALSGVRTRFEETRFDIDFQYTLSPILENNQIIGVSIFADNITEQKLRDKQLAAADKKIGELQLMALRSVMSPHFIYNVLNSIQFFIAKNEKKNALDYLTSFSRHIRNVLNHSVKSTITISEELESLKTYILLEQMRFENRFSFELVIDELLDTKRYCIPALLIQPYIENAIIHGLINSQKQGRLRVTVLRHPRGIQFKIVDNGIGRTAAAQIQREKIHVSMGASITNERLKLINKGHETSVEIVDLYNGSESVGTEVTVYISLTKLPAES